MDNIVISFCIPVYNQIDLVKRCVHSIIEYKGADIEVIISDDNSTDDIKGFVEELKDSRVRYYKNDVNLGHDLNIINSLIQSRGKYAFLLRSRDYMIGTAIHTFVQELKKSDCSYVTTTSLDESGAFRYRYNDSIIKKGSEALNAHFNLYIHPSGSAYRVEKQVLYRLRDFIHENIESKFGLVVHSLLRLYLSQQGDFQLISIPTWVYVRTEEQSDVAVNKTSNKKSVYAPEYVEQRFKYELMWASQFAESSVIDDIFLKLYALYLEAATWAFWFRNKDSRLRKHYQYEKIKFSPYKENKRFKDFAYQSYIELVDQDNDTSDLLSRMESISRRNIRRGWTKYFVMYFLKGSTLYNKVALAYKRIKYSKLSISN